jgi:FAD/FMN-containing dehydrogenase
MLSSDTGERFCWQGKPAKGSLPVVVFMDTKKEGTMAELFWGLRGGGGNFGVATAFEVDLLPAGMVLGGAIFYDATDAKSLLRALTRLICSTSTRISNQ